MDIGVVEIFQTPDNPRAPGYENGEAFAHLVASVKAEGVRMRIGVRPVPEGYDEHVDGGYMLIYGERRWKAAIQAGLATIPAIVYYGLSDDEAFDLTFAENWSRSDLTPLEEARAIRLMIEHCKGDIDAAASRLDVTPRRARQLVRIDDHLSQRWKNTSAHEWHEGDLTVSHLALIARYEDAEQDALFDVIERRFFGEFPTVRELETVLAERERKLASAPWDTEDADLCKDRPACNRCNRRSDIKPGLFDDLPSPSANDAKCTDPACWDEKLQAWLKVREKELRKEHGDALELVSVEKEYGYQAKGKVLAKNDYTRGKKADPATLPAMVVDGKKPGSVCWITLSQWIQKERKRKADEKKAKKAQKEKGKALAAEAKPDDPSAVDEDYLFELLEYTVCGQGYQDADGFNLQRACWPIPEDEHTVLRLALLFGVDGPCLPMNNEKQAALTNMVFREMPPETVWARLWEGTLSYLGYADIVDVAAARMIAGLLGFRESFDKWNSPEQAHISPADAREMALAEARKRGMIASEDDAPVPDPEPTDAAPDTEPADDATAAPTSGLPETFGESYLGAINVGGKNDIPVILSVAYDTEAEEFFIGFATQRDARAKRAQGIVATLKRFTRIDDPSADTHCASSMQASLEAYADEHDLDTCCRVCGCTNTETCHTNNGDPCDWSDADDNFCTACVEMLDAEKESA